MRMTFMAYLDGTIEAVDFYCKAFNTTSALCFKAADEDDFYAHVEISVGNQTVLALCEKAHCDIDFTNGRSMEFWLTFDDEQSIQTAYDTLKEGAEIHHALAQCEWSKTMASLTDKYGICWLLSYFE